MELDIDVENAPNSGETVLVITGSVDVQSRDWLLDEGREALRTEGITGLVLDMSGVTFLDSTGIGALIDLAHDAEDHAVTFGLRNPGPRVVRILQMTGLDARWPVE
ncbi:STAS domain-containing protein [uncultured Jatrophihabitans sp.]|uniref:STAS domain-containing protein n=1 Tax=uncultured Jatrophihabitans sp. TaxID=1610747 RepID=UPI0035CA85FA